MADNELKDLYETGTSDKDIASKKKQYADTMKLMEKTSENKAKGIELKLGPSKKDKPTDLNPTYKKCGTASARADGIAIRGKTRGTIAAMCGGGYMKGNK